MLPDLEAEAKKLEEKVDTFKRLSTMEGRIEELQETLQWALVAEIEKVWDGSHCWWRCRALTE